MCAKRLCCARLRRDAEGRNASELDSLISLPDLIFRLFYLFDRESCAQSETHTNTYIHIFIYIYILKKLPRKKGTFSRGRKRAGAQDPFYVCTCLSQDITKFSRCILVHFSSSIFHSFLPGFSRDFQSGLDQDSGPAISLFQCVQYQGIALSILQYDEEHCPARKLQADWEMLAGKEPHVAEGGSDKHLHSLCHVAV